MGKLYETETWPEGSSGNATRAKYGRRTKWRLRLAGEKLNVLWPNGEGKEGKGTGCAYSVFLMIATRHLSAARKKAKLYLIFILNGFLLAICCLLRSDLLTCLGRRWQAPLLRCDPLPQLLLDLATWQLLPIAFSSVHIRQSLHIIPHELAWVCVCVCTVFNYRLAITMGDSF